MKELYACSDDQLVQLFAAGEGAAFEELVLRYKNSVYAYLLGLVHDEGSAGDLFQDVFMALFTHAADFKAQGKVKAWLFLTARNKTFNYLRDHTAVSSLDEQDEEGNEFWHEVLPDGEMTHLEQLTQQESLMQKKHRKLLPKQWKPLKKPAVRWQVLKKPSKNIRMLLQPSSQNF